MLDTNTLSIQTAIRLLIQFSVVVQYKIFLETPRFSHAQLSCQKYFLGKKRIRYETIDYSKNENGVYKSNTYKNDFEKLVYAINFYCKINKIIRS